MIEKIALIIVVFFFLIASLEDIRKREVYDYLNYAFTFIIISIAIFNSIIINSFDPIKYVGFGLLIGFLIGSILFYLGIWGGGDAKFLIGFGAASYYLKGFVTGFKSFNLLYDNIFKIINVGFDLFVDFLLKYILILDVIFLSFIIIMLFYVKNKNHLRNIINLFTILFLLFIGLFLDYSSKVLILFGFLAFLLIFFGDEEIFYSIYFKIKKRIINLKQSEKPDKNIKNNNKTIVNIKNKYTGLDKQDIINIQKQNFTKDNYIFVRKILPFSILISLNYIIYMFKIITLEKTNLTILGFLIKFMFYSFIAGGVLSILILLYHMLINIKQIKLKFSKIEKILLIFILVISVTFSFLNLNFLLFLMIIPIILFVNIAKSIENKIFVKDKPLSKVVPGDWISQNIKVNKKVIFSKDDFKLGINEKQIEKIKKLSKKYPELEILKVKDGLAFIPFLFIGFIILLLV